MAAVEVTISGVLYDKLNRTQQQVVLIGEGSLTGLGVGGGPVIPPGGGGQPPAGGGEHPAFPIAGPGPFPPGPGYPPYPAHPIAPGGEHPMPPIYYPPDVPPSLTPPVPPAPGSPTTPVPPPEGSGGWPVAPIVPPAYIVVNYPGIGPVTVAQPLTAQPKA